MKVTVSMDIRLLRSQTHGFPFIIPLQKLKKKINFGILIISEIMKLSIIV